MKKTIVILMIFMLFLTSITGQAQTEEIQDKTQNAGIDQSVLQTAIITKNIKINNFDGLIFKVDDKDNNNFENANSGVPDFDVTNLVAWHVSETRHCSDYWITQGFQYTITNIGEYYFNENGFYFTKYFYANWSDHEVLLCQDQDPFSFVEFKEDESISYIFEISFTYTSADKPDFCRLEISTTAPEENMDNNAMTVTCHNGVKISGNVSKNNLLRARPCNALLVCEAKDPNHFSNFYMLTVSDESQNGYYNMTFPALQSEFIIRAFKFGFSWIPMMREINPNLKLPILYNLFSKVQILSLEPNEYRKGVDFKFLL